MKFKYEDLEIWQVAGELIKTVYTILKKFPDDEKFGLISQGRRAATSIALNIAEGSGRHTDKDFGQSVRLQPNTDDHPRLYPAEAGQPMGSLFINRSITSLLEVDAVLKLGIILEYINQNDYKVAEPIIDKEYFKLIAFDKALTTKPEKRTRYGTRKA